MTKDETLLKKLINQEQIVLCRGTEFIRLASFILLIISLLSSVIILSIFNISVISIISILFIGSSYILFHANSKKYVSATIKGEMIIIKDVYNKNKITSVKSIKSMNSKNLLGMNLTTFSYKLDGKRYKVRIFKKISADQIENEEIIKAAMSLAG